MQQAENDIPKNAFRVPPGIREIPIDRATGKPLMGNAPADGKGVIKEAFLTGGPIFKPQKELDEELKEKGTASQPILKPEDLGTNALDESGGANMNEGAPPPTEIDTGPNHFQPPAPGALAPYQRPVDPQGFDPSGAATGTGGVY